MIAQRGYAKRENVSDNKFEEVLAQLRKILLDLNQFILVDEDSKIAWKESLTRMMGLKSLRNIKNKIK